MKHIMQRTNECMLATVAMLGDLDYDMLRESAVGRGWMRILGSDLVDVPRGRATTPEQTRLGLAALAGLADLDYRDTLEPPIDGRYLKGRGALFVDYGTSSHIVAFEDYVIYDPGDPEPTDWRSWVHWNAFGMVGWLVLR